MYYQENKGEPLKLNPLWYNISEGILITNLRKVKVILNKGEEGEEVFEFLIHKMDESHKGGILTCDVEAEGLAFEELGKIGYKLSLNYDEYLLDLEEQSSESGEETAPAFFPTLNYWANKIFKNTNWNYSIQMDWSSFDGIIDFNTDGKIFNYESATKEERDVLNQAREEKGLRRRDKIYEEEYVSSWQVDELTNKLIPERMIQFQEKARLPEIEKSNIYNITQELAELFGVFVKYKYYYDDTYHIINRECIFYNSYLDQQNGKFDINYGYQTSEIVRTIESADTITKMYIPTTEDSSIVNVLANKAREDYILNFDYLYSIGTITKEQYDRVEPYQKELYELNTKYSASADALAKLDLELVDLKAEQTVLNNSIIYATEQINEADKLLYEITDGAGILEKTPLNPEMVMILPDGDSGLKVNLSLEGILTDAPATLYQPLVIDYDGSVDINNSKEINFNYIFDDITGRIVVGLKIDDLSATTGRAYLVCFYKPLLKYEVVKETYTQKKLKDEARLEEVKARLNEIEEFNEANELIGGEYFIHSEAIKEIAENLELTRTDFEKMMGPALREGAWEPEDKYLDYGDKYSISRMVFNNNAYLGGLVNTIWDLPFEGEQVLFYEEGVVQEKKYYRTFLLTEDMYFKVKNDFDSFFIRYEIFYELPEQPPEVDYLGRKSSYDHYFIKKPDGSIIPCLIVTDKTISDEATNFSLCKPIVNEESGEMTPSEDMPLEEIFVDDNYSIVYPRIEFNSTELKTDAAELNLRQTREEQHVLLEKFTDFSIFLKQDKYYLTINNITFLEGDIISTNGIFSLASSEYYLDFVLSNANLHLYLDGLEVAKTNAFPKVSYTVSIQAVDKNLIKYSYQKLNHIANINDAELMLENVQGYISGIEMDLNKPWEDTFTIQNYKNKFEDLFSRIVASSEAMRQNQVSYDRASSAFNANGTINGSILQNTLNNVDLSYSFNNGNLIIDELNGIWACSENGVVAMRGGGIFCATEKDVYNNWLWNTGITPSGINASMLSAGTINTNLIRIYADGNLRFQLNGEGLFAYAQAALGEPNYDKYVVHNSDGLFLTEHFKKEDADGNEIREKVDLVEVSWDGFIIRNKNNEKVFYADENGDLTITGQISANSGKIGRWQVNDSGLVYAPENSTYLLRNVNYTAALLPPTEEMEDTSPIFWVGENFKVTKDGSLFARNASFHGTLIAGTVVDLGEENTPSLSSTLKKMDVVSIGAGNTFKRYNNNYDGNIIADPSSLRFQLLPKNFVATRNDISFTIGGETVVGEHFYWDDTFGNEALIFIVNIDFMGDEIEKTVLISYTNENIQTSLILSLENHETEKKLSEIEPGYYNFILNSGESSSHSFSISLEGFEPEEIGTWYLNNSMLDLKNNTIEINSNDIDSQAILRYTINGVSREALISKTITPENNITLVIKSSKGTVFKNGNIETTLSAILYQNNTIIENDNYGYLWKKDGNIIEEFKNKKSITIENGDFSDKSIYTCDVYETKAEVENMS